MSDIITLNKGDFNFLPDSIEKLLENNSEITIDLNTAKKIFLEDNCTYFFYCNKLGNWIENEHKDLLDSWVDEFLKEKLSILKAVEESKNSDFDKNIDHLIHQCIRCTKNKDILKNTIEVFEIIGKKYGFRTAFQEGIRHESDFGPNPSAYQLLVGYYAGSYKERMLLEFPEANRFGFIHLLSYCKYDDLLKMCIDKILVPFANDIISSPDGDINFDKNRCYYDGIKRELKKIGDDIVNYFDEKVDKRIKYKNQFDINLVKTIGRMHFSRAVGIWTKSMNKWISADVYAITNHIFITNASFINKSDNRKFYLVDPNALQGIKTDEIKISLLKEDLENDIAIISSEDLYLIPIEDFTDVDINEYVQIIGHKTRFDKNDRRFNPLNAFKFIEGNAKKEISEQEMIEGMLDSYSDGSWNYEHCTSFGAVTEINNNFFKINAPYTKETYGAAVFNEKGELLGLLKPSSENSDKQVAVSYKVIQELIKGLGIYER